MGSKFTAMFFIFLIFMLVSLPPIYACVPCTQPHPPPYHGPTHPKVPRPNPPSTKHPPRHGGSPKVEPPSKKPPMPPVIVPPIIITPPITNPPVISPPTTNPPVTIPTPSAPYPPYSGGPPSGGGGGGGGSSPAPPTTQPTCPVNALKLGLCVDVLGGLVHIGLGNPVENACCPVLGGLLELEAAVCLCTAIRIKLLNLNIFIPLALQALITCGKNPPPGFLCPPL
ncbi:36.4 kDa proline-rich protein-like [Durio zibethinus]|uniref:36.4 kDa proline-rich protein-like n=1 Tax=Durio zibethinus TaxID=66656 RepID=A0A6P5Y9M7_DURZI|nr:36.4 kDa proline-rich protein-like [Durio zibethinus]